MGESFSDNDLRDLHRMLQQMALAAYPNPQREGCPGSTVLDEVASAPTPFQHPAYEHIKRCSPCLQEMLDLRGANIRARKSAAHRRKRVWVITGILAACLLVSFFLLSPVLSRKHDRSSFNSAVGATVVWNMQALSTTRGDETESKQFHLETPPQKEHLSVILPLGSDDGQYELQIRRIKDSAALVHFTGRAHLNAGNTQLELDADLSTLSPGSYWVAFRHADASWRLVPLVVQ